MSFTIGTFNANNLFARYRFLGTYPGDKSGKSKTTEPFWGYLPMYDADMFELFNPEQRLLTAGVITATQEVPDVLCMQEVESLIALRLFDSEYLNNLYPYRFLVDSRDFRQIDVAVLSRTPLLGIRSHLDDVLETGEFEGEYVFKRDLLEVTVHPSDLDKPLTLFVGHLKSKYAESQEEEDEANRRRQVEADNISRSIRERYPGDSFTSEYFAVVGDFNDTPDSPYLKPLVQDLGVVDALSDRIDNPEERWTYYWKAKYRVEQIDFILLSQALDSAASNFKPKIERCGIGFKGLSTVDGGTLPRQVSLASYANSDTWPKIDFRYNRLQGVSSSVAASDHCLVSLRLA